MPDKSKPSISEDDYKDLLSSNSSDEFDVHLPGGKARVFSKEDLMSGYLDCPLKCDDVKAFKKKYVYYRVGDDLVLCRLKAGEEPLVKLIWQKTSSLLHGVKADYGFSVKGDLLFVRAASNSKDISGGSI